METTTAPAFDAVKYKQSTLAQWQNAAEAWYRWTPLLNQWLGKSTDKMLEMAGVRKGHTVLDIAAGAGDQSVAAARLAGETGHVLATDISPNILSFARELAAKEGVTNIETAVMDGEDLRLEDSSLDAVISRVGLIYFPNQHKALSEMYRVLKPGGKLAAIVYSTPDRNKFFSIPVSTIRNRANLPAPVPGQPGPFSLGSEGVAEAALEKAGFKNVTAVGIDSPVLLPDAKTCVQFEKESFGALHQLMSSLSENEQQSVWAEIEKELQQFETPVGFVGPCEMIVVAGEKS